MLDRVMGRIRHSVWTRAYVLTAHAREEMIKDGLSIFDLECALVTGGILERQKDRATRETKYRVRGSDTVGKKIEVVGKFARTRRFVVITVFPSCAAGE